MLDTQTKPKAPSSLGAHAPMVDNPSPLKTEQQQAIIHQLVLPFGAEGKVEPAIHIHATAAGYQKVYQAIADSMTPSGDIAVHLAKAIHNEMPELPIEAAIQSAQSYTVNRRNQALGVAQAFANDGPLVQTAVEISARIINGQMEAKDVPVGKHSVESVLDGKGGRIEQYASTPTGAPRENDATHAMSFAAGHIPMHKALAKMFTAESPLVDIIASNIQQAVPEATPEMARGTAAGYLAYGEGMALMDVKHIPDITQKVIDASLPGYASAQKKMGDADIVAVLEGKKDIRDQLEQHYNAPAHSDAQHTHAPSPQIATQEALHQAEKLAPELTAQTQLS